MLIDTMLMLLVLGAVRMAFDPLRLDDPESAR
jgi:hypothetical protein